MLHMFVYRKAAIEPTSQFLFFNVDLFLYF